MAALTQGAPPPSPLPGPESVPVAWAIGFLYRIGAPVNANNIDLVIRWGQAESGNPATAVDHTHGTHGGWANYNPLNVVAYSGSGAIDQGGSQGDIADFGDLNTGVDASAQLFLNNGNAASIINTLKAGNATPSQMNAAIDQFYSTWTPGGSHFAIAGSADTTDSPTGTSTAGSTNDATLTSDFSIPGLPGWLSNGVVNGATGGAFDVLQNIPFLKGITSLPTAILKIINDWRYIVEVLAGLTLMGIGLLLILHDTGTLAKARNAGNKAAEIGAVAA